MTALRICRVECIQCLYDEDGYMTHLFTAMLGGQVLSWALDLEQNLEVYRWQPALIPYLTTFMLGHALLQVWSSTFTARHLPSDHQPIRLTASCTANVMHVCFQVPWLWHRGRFCREGIDALSQDQPRLMVAALKQQLGAWTSCAASSGLLQGARGVQAA